jgi:hypothetical protein
MNFSEFEEGQKSGFFLDFANLLVRMGVGG